MMTPEQAKALYPKTAILVLTNLPQAIRLGIDNSSWQVGEKFMGFKLIPEGCHYLHFSLKSEKHMFKQGIFLYLKEGDTLVKEWNPDIETFESMRDKEQESSKK